MSAVTTDQRVIAFIQSLKYIRERRYARFVWAGDFDQAQAWAMRASISHKLAMWLQREVISRLEVTA